MTDGWRLPIFAVVDDYIRECLAPVADTSISGIRVARELCTRPAGPPSVRVAAVAGSKDSLSKFRKTLRIPPSVLVSQ
jgi:hypothetical protein